MECIKVKQDGIAKYLRDLVGNDCSIGLHEIGLNSLYEDREETANKIMSEGLDNKRDGTTYFTVAYFGKEGHEFDINTYDANTSVGKENFTGDVVKALKFSYVIGSVNDGTSKLTLWVGDWQSKYKDGECTGGESLHDGNYNLETPTEEIQYFIYTPTEDEWANLKAQGMAIQGYAVKLIKLELVDNN